MNLPILSTQDFNGEEYVTATPQSRPSFDHDPTLRDGDSSTAIAHSSYEPTELELPSLPSVSPEEPSERSIALNEQNDIDDIQMNTEGEVVEINISGHPVPLEDSIPIPRESVMSEPTSGSGNAGNGKRGRTDAAGTNSSELLNANDVLAGLFGSVPHISGGSFNYTVNYHYYEK